MIDNENLLDVAIHELMHAFVSHLYDNVIAEHRYELIREGVGQAVLTAYLAFMKPPVILTPFPVCVSGLYIWAAACEWSQAKGFTESVPLTNL